MKVNKLFPLDTITWLSIIIFFKISSPPILILSTKIYSTSTIFINQEFSGITKLLINIIDLSSRLVILLNSNNIPTFCAKAVLSNWKFCSVVIPPICELATFVIYEEEPKVIVLVLKFNPDTLTLYPLLISINIDASPKIVLVGKRGLDMVTDYPSYEFGLVMDTHLELFLILTLFVNFGFKMSTTFAFSM